MLLLNDKVRRTRSTVVYGRGHGRLLTGTVTGIERIDNVRWLRVKWDGGTGGWFTESEVQLVESAGIALYG